MSRLRQAPNLERLKSGASGGADGAPSGELSEFPTQSLFDQYKEKKLPILHNLVIIGRLKDTWEKQPELADYYQNFIKSLSNPAEKRPDNFQQNNANETNVQPVTGLLLIFPTLFVHYLEVTNAVMKLILEDLDRAVHHERGLVREASILNISYNISSRSYPNWSYKSIKLAVEDLDAQPAETTEAIALEVLTKLLRLARYQADERQRHERPVDVLANIDQQRADLLPNQVSINYLLKQPIFRTAEDILKNYTRPINMRFESDFTAPPTHRLFPITF